MGELVGNVCSALVALVWLPWRCSSGRWCAPQGQCHGADGWCRSLYPGNCCQVCRWMFCVSTSDSNLGSQHNWNRCGWCHSTLWTSIPNPSICVCVDVASQEFELLLCRQAPGLREDVVLFREEAEHLVHVPCQQILPTDLIHPRKVVDFLYTPWQQIHTSL